MKVAIIGSRGFDDYDLLKSKLAEHINEIECIISGGAKDHPKAIKFGKEWLKEIGEGEAEMTQNEFHHQL